MALKPLLRDFIASAIPVIVPPRAHTCHDYVDLAVCITPYFLGSSRLVDLWVGRISKLLEYVIVARVLG